MATLGIPKPSKWFSSKSFKLNLPRLHPPKTDRDNSSRSTPPPPLAQLTPKGSTREDQFQKVFRYLDSDGDGKISSYEIRAYFGSIGENMSRHRAEEVISDLDSDGDNLLDFADFVRLMERDGEDDLKQAFDMFQVEEGAGCITPLGLQRMFTRLGLGDSKSYDDCVAMIKIFDLDGNGVLDFQEFQRMMTP
ncbi:PREDICTED: probable calcium-binding protein CML41 [Nelumbo nucifera]|uniref:EF-hand domain-containing protein n=2 Tax=Nelumbo nucifera TaxID=4432 RepID=A0A822XRJ9_NELNU|nr:PREDICTED: probable calcium-binding protein CML41 [Nelumbo nucifera]DAD21771.1 TPA_asm: hypothetical protein HUJ06_023234 [Nelumbo nucifera]